MKRLVIILNNGVEETEAIATIDLLRRAKIEVEMLGVDGLNIKGSHDIQFKAEKTLDKFKFEAYDGLILPGGPGVKALLDNSEVIKITKQFHREGKLIAAICAAPQILGKAEIIKGINVTHFPGADQFLTGALDKSPKSVVVDKNIITGVGVGGVFDFALAIIAYLEGNELAQKIKSEIIYDY